MFVQLQQKTIESYTKRRGFDCDNHEFMTLLITLSRSIITTSTLAPLIKQTIFTDFTAPSKAVHKSSHDSLNGALYCSKIDAN
jgi:hypothetical protein